MNSSRFALFLFWLFFSLCAFAESSIRQLSYTIRPVSINDEVQLEVRLKFKTEEKPSTFLFLPSTYGGQAELYREITKIKCLNSETSIERTEFPDILKINHIPGNVVEIVYRLKSTHSDTLDWYYRPIIENDHFLFFGYCFFITPEMDRDQPARITLKWTDFPKKCSIANSFGIEQRKQGLKVPLSYFLHAAFAGGDFTFLSFENQKSPICIAIKDRWSFSIDHLTQLLETIIKGQRNFWEDNHFPNYLITVMPSKSDQHIAGTAVNNAFSIFIHDFPETSQASWNQLGWLLSHEHFHTWNGLKMKTNNSKGSTEWFTEGFTEYYAIELNYRMNLLSFEEYLIIVNKMLYDYYTSPVRNAKNEKIPRKFWKDMDYQRLPYLRGFCLALNWNQEIKKLSKNRYSLDDLMHSLFKNAQKSQRPLDNEAIRKLAGKYIGEEAASYDIKQYILKGKTIPLQKDLFEERAILDWKEVEKEYIPQFIPSLTIP